MQRYTYSATCSIFDVILFYIFLYIFKFTRYFSSDERAALVRKNQELQRRIEGLKQEITLLDYQQRLVSLF